MGVLEENSRSASERLACPLGSDARPESEVATRTASPLRHPPRMIARPAHGPVWVRARITKPARFKHPGMCTCLHSCDYSDLQANGDYSHSAVAELHPVAPGAPWRPRAKLDFTAHVDPVHADVDQDLIAITARPGGAARSSEALPTYRK